MTEWFPHIAFAFGLLFGSGFILIGLALVAVGWSTLRLRLGQCNWVRVPAEVLSTRVETRTLDEAVNYLPKVSYRFSAQGGYVTSQRLALAEKMYPSEAKARRILEKYPVGATVMASYPADEPEEVVLEPGGGVAGVVILLLGLAMVVGPLLAGTAAGLPGKEIGLGIAVVVLLLWGWTSLWQRRRLNARRYGLLPPPGCGGDAEVERLVGLGEKLLAVHLYREVHGTDLQSAKQAVEELTARHRSGAS